MSPRDLWKTPSFAQSRRQAQTLILEILKSIPVVTILAFLDLEQNWAFFKGLFKMQKNIPYVRKKTRGNFVGIRWDEVDSNFSNPLRRGSAPLGYSPSLGVTYWNNIRCPATSFRHPNWIQIGTMVGKDENSLSSEDFDSNFKFGLYYAIGMPSHSAQND